MQTQRPCRMRTYRHLSLHHPAKWSVAPRGCLNHVSHNPSAISHVGPRHTRRNSGVYTGAGGGPSHGRTWWLRAFPHASLLRGPRGPSPLSDAPPSRSGPTRGQAVGPRRRLAVVPKSRVEGTASKAEGTVTSGSGGSWRHWAGRPRSREGRARTLTNKVGTSGTTLGSPTSQPQTPECPGTGCAGWAGETHHRLGTHGLRALSGEVQRHVRAGQPALRRGLLGTAASQAGSPRLWEAYWDLHRRAGIRETDRIQHEAVFPAMASARRSSHTTIPPCVLYRPLSLRTRRVPRHRRLI